MRHILGKNYTHSQLDFFSCPHWPTVFAVDGNWQAQGHETDVRPRRQGHPTTVVSTSNYHFFLEWLRICFCSGDSFNFCNYFFGMPGFFALQRQNGLFFLIVWAFMKPMWITRGGLFQTALVSRCCGWNSNSLDARRWCCLQTVWTLPLTTMCLIICVRLLQVAPHPVWTGLVASVVVPCHSNRPHAPST